MSLKSYEAIKFDPLNLCCALNNVEAKCTLCHRSFCYDCFYKFHVINRNSMSCNNRIIKWSYGEYLIPAG